MAQPGGANLIELRKREEKCTKLAAWLATQFLTVVSAQSDEEWEHSAAQAGVNKPSDISKVRIIEILKARLK